MNEPKLNHIEDRVLLFYRGTLNESARLKLKKEIEDWLAGNTRVLLLDEKFSITILKNRLP